MGLATRGVWQQLECIIMLALCRGSSMNTAVSHGWTSQERVNDPGDQKGQDDLPLLPA